MREKMKEEEARARVEAIASAVELCEQGEVSAALAVLRSVPLPADVIAEQMTEDCARAFIDRSAVQAVWEEKFADGHGEGRKRLAAALRECAVPIFGEGSADAGRLLQSAGVLFLALGDNQAAYDTCSSALSFKEEALGPWSTELCGTLHTLGNAAWKMDADAVQQEAMLQRSLKIEEKAFGQESVEVARTLGSLGLCYERLKKPAKAQQVLARAQDIYRAAGDDVRAGLTLGACVATAESRKAKRDFLDRAFSAKQGKYGTWEWPPCPELAKAYNPRSLDVS